MGVRLRPDTELVNRFSMLASDERQAGIDRLRKFGFTFRDAPWSHLDPRHIALQTDGALRTFALDLPDRFRASLSYISNRLLRILQAAHSTESDIAVSSETIAQELDRMITATLMYHRDHPVGVAMRCFEEGLRINGVILPMAAKVDSIHVASPFHRDGQLVRALIHEATLRLLDSDRIEQVSHLVVPVVGREEKPFVQELDRPELVLTARAGMAKLFGLYARQVKPVIAG